MIREDIVKKAKKIRLLILDVDGVLTEGSIIYDNKGRELRIFNVKDGLGVFLLTQRGFPVVILTAKDSKIVKKRARDMGINDVFSGYPKEEVLDKIIKKYKVGLEEVAFVGDDLIDIEVAKRVGFSIAVNDAAEDLKKTVDFVTENKGGKGAVREVTEIILQAKGFK
ncbi:MAG: HAD-IIIA family hydrolase [Candidatus Omnitrophica bacterium]|nr:HAD-IIIA family hydrolase [Candidatus Omnitrophota bacterium]